ncbi:MAG TPA: CpaF family protein [Candidatus Eisenbacteria bacterium]|nr:CpaF family protein [Candidatus Eisenbacteria bacterium]
MSIRDRFRRPSATNAPSTTPTAEQESPNGRASVVAPQVDEYTELKRRLHRDIIGKLNMQMLDGLDEARRRDQVESLARRLLTEQDVRITRSDEERLIQELLHDTFDLGPITPFLLDEEISDILVNTHRQVYVERLGRLEMTGVQFRDDAHLRLIIDRIISRVGRRIDESTPLVDARLPDGSRVNAIIPPAALDGPILSIRRFRRRALSIDNLLELGSITEPMARLLRGAIRARINMLITGGTGSGKTTLLNILSRYIPDGERIVTIEDSAELMLQQPHVVRLETRPPNIEGKGQITQRDLVRNSLRMRPDRIVVGEVRGDEVLDMLQAMNTGHDGSLTTIHSNGPRDALHRLENLVLMAGHALQDKAIREQVASALQIIVHVSRVSDGTRKVLSIAEITGMEGPVVTMQEIFKFHRTGTKANGQVEGRFEATGVVPHFVDQIKLAGVDVTGIFERGAK